MAAWLGDFPLTVAGQLQQLVAQLRQRVVALAAACQAPAVPEEGPGAPSGPDEGPVLQGPVGDLARARSGGLQGGGLLGGRSPSTCVCHWEHVLLVCVCVDCCQWSSTVVVIAHVHHTKGHPPAMHMTACLTLRCAGCDAMC